MDDPGTAEGVDVEEVGPQRSPGRWALGAAFAALGPVSRLSWYLGANAAQLADPTPVFVAMAVAATLCVGVTVGFARASNRSPVVVGAAIGAVGHLAFGASIFGDDPVQRPVVWVVVASLVAIGVGDLARRTIPRVLLLVVAVAATTFGLGSFVQDRPTSGAARSPVVASTDAVRTPDVWFFLADGLGRGDQLARLVDHDASWFERELESRGFAVDPDSTVNYPETDLSVPTMLEQELRVLRAEDLGMRTALRSTVRGANRTVEELGSLGYRYVHAAPGLVDWLRCDPDLADLCVDPGARSRVRLGESARAVLDLTPMGPAVRATASRTDPVAEPGAVVAEVLDRRRALGDEPIFVYSHLMTPHPPYRTDRSCQPLDRWVGGLAGGWPDDERTPYAEATACLERQFVDAIDAIVASDPDAIIVIASDHGPGFALGNGPLQNWTSEEVATRFAAFRATRVPVECGSDDRRASSAVNTFRVVLACLRGSPPELVEPRAFLTFGDRFEELSTPIIEGA